MSRIILRLLVALLVIGPLTRLVAQESKRYFFAGSIYYYNAEGAELRCPYPPVYMARQDAPDEVLAVAVSNAVGEVSFYGVPMDITKNYIFSFDLGAKRLRYLFKGLPKPNFSGGNVSIHMRIDKFERYLHLRRVTPTGGDKSRSVLELATAAIKGAQREGLTITNAEGLSYRLFINGRPISGDKQSAALKVLTGEYLRNILITEPIQPNDYYAGSIDFVSTLGTDLRYDKMTYTLPLLP